MRKHVLDMSGSTLIQCTNQDEGGNKLFAVKFQRTPQKKSSASDKKTSNSVSLTRERHQMGEASWLKPLSGDHTSNHFLFFQTAKRRDHKSVVRDDQRQV